MKEKIKKTIATSTIIFSLLLATLFLSSCNNTTTTTSIENLNSKSISENKKENKTITEETEFIFSTVETTTTTVEKIKPIEEILTEKNIDVELKDYVSPEHNPMIKSVYNLYTLEDIYKLVPFFVENFNLREGEIVNPNLLSAISLRYDIATVNIQSENLQPIVYLDMLYSVKSQYFPNKTIEELKEMGISFGSQTKEEVLYILQNY